MMDTEILEMLDEVGRSAVARLGPETLLDGDTAQDRRQRVLAAVRSTILPRRLEFTVSTGDVLALEVNSSRITDVPRCSLGIVPDFTTGQRDEITQALARLLTDIAKVHGPIEFASKRPTGDPETDDVGITYSEVALACAGIELHEDTQPETADTEPAQPVADPEPLGSEHQTVAARFYDEAAGFAQGRLLFGPEGSSDPLGAGICAPDQTAHPDRSVLDQFARDLAGWDADTKTCLSQPQMVVMRPSGGQGTGLALLRDGTETAAVVHDARKLGAVVNLWEKLKGAAE